MAKKTLLEALKEMVAIEMDVIEASREFVYSDNHVLLTKKVRGRVVWDLRDELAKISRVNQSAKGQLQLYEILIDAVVHLYED